MSRVLYAQRSSSDAYENALVTLLQDLGHVVTVNIESVDASLSTYTMSDFDVLLIGEPGSYITHVDASILNDLTIPIITFCVATARATFSMGDQSYLLAVPGLKRVNTLNPKNIYTDITLSGLVSQRGLKKSGHEGFTESTLEYESSTTVTLAGIVTDEAPNGYERIFFGVRDFSNYTVSSPIIRLLDEYIPRFISWLRYHVIVTEKDNSSVLITDVYTNDKSLTITGLTEEVVYSATITPIVNYIAFVGGAKTIEFNTTGPVSRLPIPTNLQVSSISATQATVSWEWEPEE